MSTGYVDLPPSSQTVIGAVNSVNTLTGNVVLTTDDIPQGILNKYFTATGSANTIAGWDATSTLGSIPGWSFDPTYFGITSNLTLDPAPDVPSGTTINQFNIQLVPTANTFSRDIVAQSFYINIDPTNTGFDIGDNSGGGVSLLTLGANHQSSGEVGRVQGLNIQLNLGDDTITTGKIYHFSGIDLNQGLHGTASVQDISYLNLNGTWSAGTTHTGGFQGIFLGSQFSGTGMTNYNGVVLAPTFNSSMAVGANYSGLSIQSNFGAAYSSIDYHSDLNVNPTFNSGTTLTTFQSVNIGPNLLSGSSIGSYIGINLSPNGTGGIIGSAVGASINLSNVVSSTQKIGLVVNDGSFQSYTNFDTAILPASPGFFGMNSLGGLYHVASGSPTSSTLVVGNGFSTNALFEDDMGPDAFGGFLGFCNILAASQTTVAIGKTVDTFTGLAVGASVPGPIIPFDGGTITNLSNITAIGCISQGGTISVTNLYGFRVIPGFSSLATNPWGVWIGDTSADNWFAKNVVIGGATGQPTGAFELDVTGNATISGDVASATLTPANGATGTFTTVDSKTVTVTNGIITSII